MTRSLPNAQKRRRSPRLFALYASDEKVTNVSSIIRRSKTTTAKTAKKEQASSKARTRKITKDAPKQTPQDDSMFDTSCLPRTREQQLLKEGYTFVMGIDEAGRGPLAGPVVAAAAWIPTNIPGITDSKKLTDEKERERLYHEIVTSPGARWAVAIVDAPRIDEVNILQSTLQGMRMACHALASPKSAESSEAASVTRQGCYVVVGGKDLDKGISLEELHEKSYALIDGNRMPPELLVKGETMVKGDSKEYSIAAASILAKVTRDRLMNAYHDIYPQYNLIQHKGYPTKAHMAAIMEHGATPIHRRTFAPLKHMNFDQNGSVIP